VTPPTIFGVVFVVQSVRPGSTRVGREGEVEVGPDLEAGRSEERQNLLARGPGIRRRLEHDEVAGPEALGDLLRRSEHDRDVGLAVDRERRGKRHEDGVGVPEGVVVGRRHDRPGFDQGPQLLRGHVLDVALAPVERGDPTRVHVHEDRADAGLGEHLGKRDADVAGADDGDATRGDSS
jgi:hypothetical protein